MVTLRLEAGRYVYPMQVVLGRTVKASLSSTPNDYALKRVTPAEISRLRRQSGTWQGYPAWFSYTQRGRILRIWPAPVAGLELKIFQGNIPCTS